MLDGGRASGFFERDEVAIRRAKLQRPTAPLLDRGWLFDREASHLRAFVYSIDVKGLELPTGARRPERKFSGRSRPSSSED